MVAQKLREDPEFAVASGRRAWMIWTRTDKFAASQACKRSRLTGDQTRGKTQGKLKLQGRKCQTIFCDAGSEVAADVEPAHLPVCNCCYTTREGKAPPLRV